MQSVEEEHHWIIIVICLLCIFKWNILFVSQHYNIVEYLLWLK